MVLEEDPTLVFLIEIKLVVSEMDGIKSKLDRQQGLVVPSVRRGGGLLLLWRSSTKVDVQTYSSHHIGVIVTDDYGNKKWRFTSFYGYPETGKREESWRLLEELERRYALPWICMGNFNEILHPGEKVGGSLRPERQMNNFKATINHCKLRDLGYVRANYTWSRRMGARGWVKEHLDRALVSLDWMTMFLRVRLYHVATSTLDHSMLVLKTPRIGQRAPQRSKLFRFESMWLRDEQCKEVVNDAWERGRSMGTQHQFMQCLDECRKSLSTWNTNTFGHVGRKILALQKKLLWLEGSHESLVRMEEIHATKLELN